MFGKAAPEKKEKQTKSSPSKYERLAEKAHKGDVQAARELAKWCYMNDADNERAKYWLGVAASHGDSGSARVAERVQDWQ
jgi:TPR repeat protein